LDEVGLNQKHMLQKKREEEKYQFITVFLFLELQNAGNI